MENRPFDHIFGCMLDEEGLMPGADGVKDGQPILIDPEDPSKGNVTITCGTAEPFENVRTQYSIISQAFR